MACRGCYGRVAGRSSRVRRVPAHYEIEDAAIAVLASMCASQARIPSADASQEGRSPNDVERYGGIALSLSSEAVNEGRDPRGRTNGVVGVRLLRGPPCSAVQDER